MASDLIRKADVQKILKALYENRQYSDVTSTLFVAMENIHDLPAVEVIDVHSEIDINNEALSVSKLPESRIKKILARGLVEELEKYITVKKHPGMFHNTIFHARVDLVMWKGKEDG